MFGMIFSTDLVSPITLSKKLPVPVKTAAGTVGKEHHVVKFRCFDVTEGPENAQIYGEILGSKIGHICLSFDHCDYHFL